MFRRLLIAGLAAALFAVLVAQALAVRVRAPRRRQDEDDLRRRGATLEAAHERADALEAASLAGEFYYHVQTASVRTSTRSAATPATAQRLELQGQRRSPPVGADKAARRRRHRALVLGDLHPPGGSPTLLLKRRAARNCYRCSRRTTAGRRPRPPGRCCSSTGAASRGRAGRGASAGTAARTRRRRGAVRSNALPVKQASSSPARPSCSPVAGRAHGAGTATLWITRDRGATVLLVQTVPGRADGDAGARPEGGHLDALRRPLRPVDRRRRGRHLASAVTGSGS